MKLLLTFAFGRLWALFLGVVIISGILIVHESAHFFVGKSFGLGYAKYSLGFGPSIRLFFVNETEFRVGAYPLGAFVEPLSTSTIKERIAEAPQHRAHMAHKPEVLLENIPTTGRFLMVLAGPASNLFLGYGLLLWVKRRKPAMATKLLVTSLEPRTQKLLQRVNFWQEVQWNCPRGGLSVAAFIAFIHDASISVVSYPWARYVMIGEVSNMLGFLNFMPVYGFDGDKLLAISIHREQPNSSVFGPVNGIWVYTFLASLLVIFCSDLYWFCKTERAAWKLFRERGGFLSDEKEIVFMDEYV